MINTIVKILDVSKNTYWNWKNQNRPIISLLDKYFSKEDLQEFLQTGKIERLECSTEKIYKLENDVKELQNKVAEIEKIIKESS